MPAHDVSRAERVNENPFAKLDAFNGKSGGNKPAVRLLLAVLAAQARQTSVVRVQSTGERAGDLRVVRRPIRHDIHVLDRVDRSKHINKLPESSRLDD